MIMNRKAHEPLLNRSSARAASNVMSRLAVSSQPALHAPLRCIFNDFTILLTNKSAPKRKYGKALSSCDLLLSFVAGDFLRKDIRLRKGWTI